MKKLPIFIGLVVALAAGVVLWQRAHERAPGAGFTTGAVTRGRLEAKVTATGTLSPLVNVQVGSQVSGRVAELHADFNSQVKKGQVIAKLDTALFEAAAQQERANLIAAEGKLAKAKAEALDAKRKSGRTSELAGKQLVAQADADTASANSEAAEAAVKAAEGEVALAKAALTQAQINLRYATIYSPINGVVISRSVEVGQTVAASLQAPVLFQIAEDLAKMQVDTNVAEGDVGKVTPGMEVTFRVDAYPTEIFRGKVRQVRNSPVTVQNIVTYDAVVDVANPDLKLKPGMTATLTFVYAESKDTLKIPSSALRFTMADDKGEGRKGEGRKGEGRKGEKRDLSLRNVWVLKDGQPQQLQIKVGISDGNSVEVLSGLAEGDLVITDADAPGAAPKKSGGGAMGGGRRGF